MLTKPPDIRFTVKDDHGCYWEFTRRPRPTDPHYLVAMVNGEEMLCSFDTYCHVGDLPKGRLPRDAKRKEGGIT